MKNIMLDEDKEIRNYFADIVIPVPSNYDDFIQEKISQAAEMNQQKAFAHLRVARFKRAIILVASIIVFIVGSITVVAATGDSAHEGRMLKLSEEETQRLLDNADKLKKEGWQTSRTMTEAEKERLNLLEKQYREKLLIPQSSLMVVNDRSEIIKDSLCFYPQDNYFNFPEREMTDEELLQIVDYRMTTDYVLHQRMWENQPELDGKPEQELIDNAVTEASEFFSLSKECSTSIYYNNITVDASGEGCDANADVYITDKQTGRCYTVWVDRLQGSIKRIERTDDNYSHDKVPISDEHFKRILNNLKEIAEKVSGLKCIYSDLNVEMIDDSYIDGGAGCCCYKMTNGRWVMIDFVVKDGELLRITKSAHEDYVNLVREGWKQQCIERNTKTYRIMGEV